MLYRERRSWTDEEDQLLRDAVELEEPGSLNPSKWHAIAKHVPSRTNKDCRKRWFAKMASDVVKGGWAPEEDEKLVQAIEKYGTRWSQVSAYVQTRNSDQCAKRWTDTLNPMIDRTRWSAEADALLLRAVEENGKLWTKIARTYFPGRTGLAAKNRYNSINRFNAKPPRRKSHKPRVNSESASSTASKDSTPLSDSPTTDSPTISSSASTSDTSESPSTPLSTPAELSLQGSIPGFALDSTTWSPLLTPNEEGPSRSPLSSTLTYDELCSAMLSSSGMIHGIPGLTDLRDSTQAESSCLSTSWEETYSQIQQSISMYSPPSLEMFESFLPYPTLDGSSTILNPSALPPIPTIPTSGIDVSSSLGVAVAPLFKELTGDSQACQNEQGFTTSTASFHWNPSNSNLNLNPSLEELLADWSNSF